jgi:YkoY family integral membrane protein
MGNLNWTDAPAIVGSVLTLVLLEGLLSADNALVLAVMVRHLPKPQQKRALRYGIWGAFLFRALAVVFVAQLIQFWQLKALGGLYLIYLAVRHFLGGGDHAAPSEAESKPRLGRGFWATVVNVELADIAFSIDSILAGVAMVEGLPQRLQDNEVVALSIIYAGGVLGIIMMRLVAGVFLVLLNRYQGLADGAYVLVGWIGLKLAGGGLHDAFHPRPDPDTGRLPGLGWRAHVPPGVRNFPWEMPHWFFWVGMAVIVVASLLYRPGGRRKPESGPGQREHREAEEILRDAGIGGGP